MSALNNKIASFAVLDLETSGLPNAHFNNVNITEIAIHGFNAVNMNNSINCKIPRIINKLILVFQPHVMIHPKAAEITGLNNTMLKDESFFNANAANVIINFLEHLKKPVCLVAHNGNRFDFPLLKHALHKLGTKLPDDIMCIDSLIAIKKLDELAKEKTLLELQGKGEKIKSTNQLAKIPKDDKSYKLEKVYIRCFHVAPEKAHHAEGDVVSLERIMLHYGKTFTDYAEANAKPFQQINK